MAEVTPRRGGRLGTIAFAVVITAAIAVLAGLGTWQVQRAQWKTALLAGLHAREAAAPLDIADADGLTPDDLRFRRVTATGRFLPRVVRLHHVQDGVLGYKAILAFVLEGAQGAILVDVGFVEAGMGTPTQVEAPSGPIEIAAMRAFTKAVRVASRRTTCRRKPLVLVGQAGPCRGARLRRRRLACLIHPTVPLGPGPCLGRYGACSDGLPPATAQPTCRLRHHLVWPRARRCGCACRMGLAATAAGGQSATIRRLIEAWSSRNSEEDVEVPTVYRNLCVAAGLTVLVGACGTVGDVVGKRDGPRQRGAACRDRCGRTGDERRGRQVPRRADPAGHAGRDALCGRA